MWFDCVEPKRSVQLPWSATALCTFAATPSFQACLHVFILSFSTCVYIYVYVFMCAEHVYMYIYACACVFVHLCVYTRVYVYVYACLRQIVGLGISASACGRCHACACVFVRICMRIHMCVGIYICDFFCSECYMHFTSVVGTSAWAGVYVTQVYVYTNVHICEHTRCRLCTYVYMYICVYMHVYAYGFVCASMISLDTLRRCY